MPVVVDANVAIKWIVPEELESEAEALLGQGEQFVAPDFILAEVTNIAWAKRRRGEMTQQEAEAGLRFIGDQIGTIYSSAALCDRALALAIQLDHPAYDCFYLACAEAIESVLITSDRRLHDVAVRAGLGYLVRHLSDVPLP